MKRLITIIIAATSTILSSQARLGETLSDSRERYGVEIKSNGSSAINSDYIAIFHKDNILTQITFAEYGPGDTQAIEIMYSKRDEKPFTKSEIAYLLDLNNQGYEWRTPTETLVTINWSRSDGGTAKYIPSRKQLWITSPRSLNEKMGTPTGLEGL